MYNKNRKLRHGPFTLAVMPDLSHWKKDSSPLAQGYHAKRLPGPVDGSLLFTCMPPRTRKLCARVLLLPCKLFHAGVSVASIFKL